MLVFVYGTLQRGGRLHEHLEGQWFAGEARTVPVYRLFRIDWFPGLVEADAPESGKAIHGEVWDVDEQTLAVLDVVENVESDLYERRPIRLQPPFDDKEVLGYFYLGDTEGCADCGDCW